MVVLSPFPDETLCSLLIRLCRLNGYADFRDGVAKLIGRASEGSFINTVLMLPELFERTGFIFSSPGTLLNSLTWAGAQMRLGETAESNFVAIASGRVAANLAELTFDRASTVGFCSACISADIEKFGISYWHRVHQFEIVKVCPHHGNLVSKVSLKRVNLHSRFPMPSDLAVSHPVDSHVCAVRLKHAHDVAATVLDLLQAESLALDGRVVSSAILAELRTRKLIDRANAVRRGALCEFIRTSLVTASGNAELLNGLSLRLARSLITPEKGPALGRIVLIHLLFGSWQFFREKYRWAEMFELERGSEATQQGPNLDSVRLRTLEQRQRCIEYLNRNPADGRKEFLRSEYRCFRWLLRHDRSWLDAHLPIPSRISDQLPLFR